LSSLSVIGFPFAGGDAYSYRKLREQMPPSLGFQTLELPGRGRRCREPLLTDIPAMVDDAMTWIAASHTGPLVFFGHSMGALIAYEVTRRLFREGRAEVAHLLVSGRAAPRLEFRKRRWDLPEPEFVQALRELGGFSEEVLNDPELMEYLLPVLRADVQAVDQYQTASEKPLDIPITVLIGDDDDVTIDEAQAWQAETTQPVRVERFSGGHFFLFDHAKAVARLIGDASTRLLATK
jgi:surfactin synthase thioesterase subunit